MLMKVFFLVTTVLISNYNLIAQHHHLGESRTDKETFVTADFEKQLQQLFQQYIEIKDALAEGKNKDAAIKAINLTKFISVISYRDITEGNINALRKDASLIADAKDLSVQRKAFSNLSNNMSVLAGQFKLSDNPIYQQYCPMAKAYWLSNEKEIKNPYYGSSMLSCGSVIKTF